MSRSFAAAGVYAQIIFGFGIVFIAKFDFAFIVPRDKFLIFGGIFKQRLFRSKAVGFSADLFQLSGKLGKLPRLV